MGQDAGGLFKDFISESMKVLTHPKHGFFCEVNETSHFLTIRFLFCYSLCFLLFSFPSVHHEMNEVLHRA
jgi:hypothetical protein